MPHNDKARPAANGTGEKRAGQPGDSVTRGQRTRRPADQVTAIDYEAMGFTLGYAERAAVGSALLVLERAE